jgi:hypothetical protein
MRKVILISILTSVMSGILSGQGWQRRYGQTSETEQGKFITRTEDGGFLVRASANGGDPAYSTLLRLDADGDSVWTYTAGPFPAGGAAVEDRAVYNSAGEIFSVFYDSLLRFDAGGHKVFAVAAHFYHILGVQPDGVLLWKEVNTGDTLHLRKYDIDGNLLWEKQQHIPGVLQDVKLAPDSRILALFTTWGFDNKSKMAVYDADGNGQATMDYGQAFYYKIAFDEQGNYILYETLISGQQAQNNAVYILKSTPAGQVIWKKTYLISSSDAVERIVPASNGNLILLGSSWYAPVRSPRIYGLDSNGNELWKRIFSMSHSTSIKDGVADEDGSFVVTGFIQEQPGASGPSDAIVWKFNAQGLLYPNLLRGRVVRDTLPDCEVQTTEPGMAGWTIQSGFFLSVTDDSGFYEVQADTGTTTLQLYSPGSLWQVCPDFETITLNGVFLLDTLDIPVFPTISCPQMEVSMGFQRLRRCFENTATVKWCNVGTIAENEAKILVVLPPELDFVSTSGPLSQMAGDSLWFDIGFVDVNECGSFQLIAVVNCDSSALGQVLCTTAHIFPDSFCLTEPGWSGASVQVSAQCTGDTAVTFTIKNTGAFPTSPSLEYIIIEDQVVLMSAPFNLPPGGQQVITQPVGNGGLYRIEVEQEFFHPGFSMPAAWVEGCGPATNQGLALQYPDDDGDLFVDVDCQRITGSYDPNDKSAQPEGYGPEHFIAPNTDLSYRIRFQNTGTDTAFTVIIRDTLSPWLDPATVRPEASSHPFTWNFSEGNTLKFVFDNFLLPDSTTNEPGSNGYVLFRISPRKDLPLGTVIHNRAAIYFDFNLPVITNETFHTLGRDFILVDTDTPQPGEPGVEVFPNPFREATSFRFGRDIRGILSLYTAQGQLVRQEPVNGPALRFQARGLTPGVYVFDIRENGRVLAQGKMAVQ